MDFTLIAYRKLLTALQSNGYRFQKFESFMASPAGKVVLLRHDVDLLPGNALLTARMEHGIGIAGTYYFRVVPESWDETIIREIASLGHEIGYHYENLGTVVSSRWSVDCESKTEDKERLIDLAYEDFCRNLESFRKSFDVRTIYMHGSPQSRYDNRMIWAKYDYKERGILGEPYFDVDFDDVFYLTDTGRRWDGWKVSVRDKMPQQEEWVRQGLVFHSTADIVRAAGKCGLPGRIMITVHPQRWHDRPFPWIKEFIWQNTKNIGKRLVVHRR